MKRTLADENVLMRTAKKFFFPSLLLTEKCYASNQPFTKPPPHSLAPLPPRNFNKRNVTFCGMKISDSEVDGSRANIRIISWENGSGYGSRKTLKMFMRI